MSAGQQADRVEVERLDPTQAIAAAATIASSHQDYPAFRRLFPDAAARQKILHTFMVAAVRDTSRHGHVLAARDRSGILGVALWMPPETFPLSRLRKARMTPALIRTALLARAAIRGFARVEVALEHAHPSEPSWYLQTMSVHPRAQRRGIGTRLITPILAEADAANLPCCLQTSDSANVAYYERFGFEVSQPEITTFPGGPVYIGMTRPATRHRRVAST